MTDSSFNAEKFNPNRHALPPVSLTDKFEADDVVIGAVGSKPQLIGLPESVDGIKAEVIADFFAKQGISSGVGKITSLTLHNLRLLAIGLGDDVDVSPEQLRRAAGSAVRAIGSASYANPRKVAISLDAVSPEQIQAVAEGALLAANKFAKISGEPVKQQIGEILIVTTKTDANNEAIERAEKTSSAVCVARDWTNLPPNLMGPPEFASQVSGYMKDVKVDVEILDEKALAKQGFGGILAVGGGSDRPPRLVRASYNPRGAKKHLVLIGKGITFDSGGYNLKPAGSMITMKNDMSGAADVMAAIHAIAELRLNVQVTAYGAMAESLVSGRAYRPSDVMTMHDGTTVENGNSDAEGRIVLADAISRANQDKPDLIIDVATLTGACVSALGDRVSGLFASSDEVADQVLDAAEVSGEQFWQLPITDHLRAEIKKSEVADLLSSGSRIGGLIYSAAFLEHFVADGGNWAHMDVAGPAWSDSAYSYIPKESTGTSVRTLIAVAEQMSN